MKENPPRTVSPSAGPSPSSGSGEMTPSRVADLEYTPMASATRMADMPCDEKPREKALRYGVSVLTTSELIAITLGSGIQGKSVLALSKEILDASGNSLQRLSRMSIKEISRRFKGMGAARATTLSAAIELGCRCRDEVPEKAPQVRSSRDAYSYIIRCCQGLERKTQEEFWALYLARNNTIKCGERIGVGSTNATLADPKIILKKAIDNLAEGIILVHNHPSGNLNPSRADEELTRKVKSGACLFDIKVLDHLIIVPGGYFSFADEGRMP